MKKIFLKEICGGIIGGIVGAASAIAVFSGLIGIYHISGGRVKIISAHWNN